MSVLNKYNFPPHVKERIMTKVASTVAELETNGNIKTAATAMDALIGGTAAAAVTYGIPKLFDAISAARVRSNKQKNLNAMKQVHPELRMMSERSLDIAYNSLAIHSPSVLEDPLVGGQMIRDIAQRGSMDINQLKTVSQLRGTGVTEHELAAVKELAGGVRGSIMYNTDAGKKTK